MKKIILVHGWDGNPTDAWKTWLKNEVEEKGFKFIAPQMPGGKYPLLEDWLNVLALEAGNVDKNTYFVGHSLGCITVLKYLERLPSKSKVGGCFLVSGFMSSLGIAETENFFHKPLNLKNLINKTFNFIAINSDNDPYVPLKYAYELRDQLKASLIIMHSKGHIGESAKIHELPVLLNKILEISK
jgi:predicted alpha/beta hydrolase family esterase